MSVCAHLHVCEHVFLYILCIPKSTNLHIHRVLNSLKEQSVFFSEPSAACEMNCSKNAMKALTNFFLPPSNALLKYLKYVHLMSKGNLRKPELFLSGWAGLLSGPQKHDIKPETEKLARSTLSLKCNQQRFSHVIHKIYIT